MSQTYAVYVYGGRGVSKTWIACVTGNDPELIKKYFSTHPSVSLYGNKIKLELYSVQNITSNSIEDRDTKLAQLKKLQAEVGAWADMDYTTPSKPISGYRGGGQ